MKIIFQNVLSVLLVVLSFCLNTASPISAKSYTISPVTIDIELNADGSATVHEIRNFNFDGSYTFAYQQINTSPNQSTNPGRTEAYQFANLSLCDKTQCYRQLAESEIALADEARPPQTYYLLQNPSDIYLK